MARFLEDWSKISTIPNFSQIITLRLIWKKRGKNPKPQLIPEIILIPSTLKLSFGTFKHLEPIPKVLTPLYPRVNVQFTFVLTITTSLF